MRKSENGEIVIRGGQKYKELIPLVSDNNKDENEENIFKNV